VLGFTPTLDQVRVAIVVVGIGVERVVVLRNKPKRAGSDVVDLVNNVGIEFMP
jgi:hypothetical protein